jgi:serine/arginine repetitive matrix protein 2
LSAQHERKRKVELRIAEFEDAMEEQGYSEEEIERETAALREKMLAEELRAKEVASEARKLDTHQIAEKKAKELEKLASALGVGRDSRPGDSFNPEIQAERREREKMQRELEKKERHEAYLQVSGNERRATCTTTLSPEDPDAFSPPTAVCTQREAARKERDERRRREDAEHRCVEPRSTKTAALCYATVGSSTVTAAP